MADSSMQNDTATFDHFGTTWTVPTRRRLSHLVQMRDKMNARYGDANIAVAEVFLGPEQFARLLEIDPDEPQLDAFVDQIGKTLKLGDSGNS
jgi:hypothetical protein